MPLPNCSNCENRENQIEDLVKKLEKLEDQFERLARIVEEYKILNRAKHETIVALKEQNEQLKTSIEFWYGELAKAIKFNEEGLRN